MLYDNDDIMLCRRHKMNMLIKTIRSYTKLSQQELADKLGVTAAAIDQWEEASSVPNKLAQMKLYAFCKGPQPTIACNGLVRSIF